MDHPSTLYNNFLPGRPKVGLIAEMDTELAETFNPSPTLKAEAQRHASSFTMYLDEIIGELEERV